MFSYARLPSLLIVFCVFVLSQVRQCLILHVAPVRVYAFRNAQPRVSPFKSSPKSHANMFHVISIAKMKQTSYDLELGAQLSIFTFKLLASIWITEGYCSVWLAKQINTFGFMNHVGSDVGIRLQPSYQCFFFRKWERWERPWDKVEQIL